ncbi:signal transduction histidine kinase [Rhodococcus sp. LBL1]|nr:signal transduction histidine kinase [Rhodococcus sp. LBL1]MDH6684467.1 signal transduction histidine kinase [Rhodococcus sp. LBL2]
MTTPGPRSRPRRATWGGRLGAWWRAWVSDVPRASAPGRFQLAYGQVRTFIARHPTTADVVVALTMAVCATPQLAYHARHNSAQFGTYLLFSALLVVPLIWRRRFPLSAFAFATAAALAQWFVGVELAADVTLLVYLYTVASRYPLRVALLAAGVVEAGALLAAARWPLALHWSEMFVLLSGPVLAGLLLGVNVRNRRNVVNALNQRAEQLERERDQQTLIAAAEERTRIAREMHDVVAHSLLVMVTLSEGAALKQAREPERAAAAMRQVSSTGRQALDDVRRLLGVLRTENAPQARQPQPGIAQIDALLDQVRATGLAADALVTGTPEAIAPGPELTVYRIVQEALTNTLKHAVGATRVRVVVDCRIDSVSVDVHDDGAPQPTRTDPSTAGGHGVTGMRERAAVYDGTVSVGPDAAGGWRVHARLPLPTPGARAGTPSTERGAAR